MFLACRQGLGLIRHACRRPTERNGEPVADSTTVNLLRSQAVVAHRATDTSRHQSTQHVSVSGLTLRSILSKSFIDGAENICLTLPLSRSAAQPLSRSAQRCTITSSVLRVYLILCTLLVSWNISLHQKADKYNYQDAIIHDIGLLKIKTTLQCV